MIRTFLPAIIAFAAACAGTTALAFMRARGAQESPPPSAEHAPKAHADTLPDVPYDGAPADTTHAPTSARPPEGQHTPAGDSAKGARAHGDSATAGGAAKSLAATEPAGRPLPTITASTVPPIDEGRLAKLFGAMSARDATRVLEQMSDSDVVEILAGLTDRRAGEILALFPAPRAATVAKALRTHVRKGT